MGKYKIALTDRAKDHLLEWKKSGQLIALRRIEKIFVELSNTPFNGIGSPEPLNYGGTLFLIKSAPNKNQCSIVICVLLFVNSGPDFKWKPE